MVVFTLTGALNMEIIDLEELKSVLELVEAINDNNSLPVKWELVRSASYRLSKVIERNTRVEADKEVPF